MCVGIQNQEKSCMYNDLNNLNDVQAKHNLRNYGKTLMEAEPDKTTELLKLLCTDCRSSESKYCLELKSINFKLFLFQSHPQRYEKLDSF